MSDSKHDVDSATLAELKQQLAEAVERNLNAIDAIRGAEARAAQAKRDSAELFHRLDVRETELRRLKELLGFDLETPFDEVRATITDGSDTPAAFRPAETAGG